MAAKMEGIQFLRKGALDSADTLWVENILSRTVSEINAFLHFMQKFKMATKNGGKTIFWEITLSCTVIEINAFLQFTQKFKLAAKNGRKTVLGESCQLTPQKP